MPFLLVRDLVVSHLLQTLDLGEIEPVESSKSVIIPVVDYRSAMGMHALWNRVAQLGARQRALPDKCYGVIYADPLKVMKAWRFEYKSHAIWAKDRVRMGYWFRNQHELLLVGTRGVSRLPQWGRSGRR